jgi:peptidoglycan/LPS O-acetylase OafA/YrhL
MLRLLPPLLIMLAIAYPLAFYHIVPGGTSIEGLLAQTFYFSNYYSLFFDPGHTTPDGTGILWSLAVEEHFYIFYPLILATLLGAGVRLRTATWIFAIACIAILAWRFHLVSLPNFTPDRTYYASDTRIDSIFYGCIFALAFNPTRERAHATDNSATGLSSMDYGLLSAGIALLLATLVIRGEAFRETLRYSLQGVVLMPIFYLAVRRADRFPFTLLNLPWVKRLGVYSYVVYLIHYVVIKALEANVPAVASRPFLTFLAAMAISVPVAAAIDQWIDPYFRILRHRLRSEPQLALTQARG